MINNLKLRFSRYIFCGILFLAVILRFYQLGFNPPSIDWDEASLGYNAYSIYQTGADEYGYKYPLSIRSFDDYKPPLYAYLTVPSVAVFGLNEFSVRLPSAILGVAGVFVMYFIVLNLLEGFAKNTSRIIALTAMFFTAVSPWHLQFSRAAFEGNIGLTFFLCGLLFFLLGLKKGKHFFFSAFFFILAVYSYHSFRLFIPVLLLCLVIIFLSDIKKRLRFFLLSAALFIICTAPVYISLIQPQGSGSRLSMVTVFSRPDFLSQSIKRIESDNLSGNNIYTLLHNRRVDYFLMIAKGYLDHFNPDFLFLHGDGGVQHHAVDVGMLYLWEAPFIIIGLHLLTNKRNKKIIIPFLILLLAPLPASITTGTPHPVRAIAMVPAFHIFSAAGAVFAAYYLRSKSFLIFRAGLSLITLSLLINMIYYFHQYYVHTPVEYGYFWQYGYKDVMRYAKENEYLYDKIIITYAYDQPYIYYLFYNKIDPVWYQSNWDYNRNGQTDRFKRVIGKYEFRNIHFSAEIKNNKTLLIGTPDEIPDNADIMYEVKFPDGRTAFRITSI